MAYAHTQEGDLLFCAAAAAIYRGQIDSRSRNPDSFRPPPRIGGGSLTRLWHQTYGDSKPEENSNQCFFPFHFHHKRCHCHRVCG